MSASAPKRREPDQTPAQPAPIPKVKCCRCDREFPQADPGDRHKAYSFNKETGEIYCKSGPKDGPKCRAGQLRKAVKLYAIAPRERLFVMQDIRPSNWKETGWRAAFSEEDRVMACILYQSWCWPVCMEYACWIDAEDEDIRVDRHKLPIPFRQSDIATKLNMKRPNVNRACRRLAQRGLLRMDEDGLLYPIALPAVLSVDERKALAFDVAVEGLELDDYGGMDFLRSMPRAMRTGFLERYKCAGPVIRSEMEAAVEEICTDYLEELRSIKSVFNEQLKSWCLPATSLLPRSSYMAETPNPAPPSSTEAPSSPEIYEVPTNRSVGPFPGVVDHRAEEAMDEEGRGALAKMDRPRPYPTDRPMEDAAQPWKHSLRGWLESHFAKQIPGYPLEDDVLQAILRTIQTDVHLEQFQKAALRQEHPRGWKVFVRIAQRCQTLHPQYELSRETETAQPKPPMSYNERKARELEAALLAEEEESNGSSTV